MKTYLGSTPINKQYLGTNGIYGSSVGVTPQPITGSDVSADAYIAKVIAVGGTLTQPEATSIDNLFIGLRADGLLGQLVYMYPFMGGTADSHAISGLEPTSVSKTLLWVGDISQSLVHTSAGVDKTVASGSGYAYTTTTVDTYHTNVNDVAFGGYISTAVSNDLGFLVAHVAEQALSGLDRYQLNTPYNNDLVYAGSGRFDSLAIYDNTIPAVGTWIGSRVSSTDIQLYKNGSSVNTNVTANTSAVLNVSELELFSMGGSTGSNITTNGFDGVCGFIFGANGLSGAQVSTFQTRLNTYLIAIGR